MKRGQLSDYFEGVGVKRLSAVDAEPKTSNQHEVGTTVKMREDFLGETHQQKFPAIYIWLGGDQDGFTEEGWATHYDARINKPRAAEWRLYYPSNPVTEAMRAGDTLFLAKDQGGVLWFIVAPEGSTSEQQLFWLFGLRPEGKSFVSREFSDEEPELDFAARFILDEIGIEFEEPDADKLDSIIAKFGTTFPKTAEFSDLARLTLPEVCAEDDPDAALIAWLDHEEALFRRLERRIVSSRIEAGFTNRDGTDVDGFISFSLSVQNRRKSRMGHSLENHLAAVLRAHDIRHVRGAVTEHNHKPDFLFPDLATYQAAPAEGDPRLTMLGAKSTCKDRWRQVLAEAEKISRKHLLTLEPGISEPQTDQMEASSLQLVVPSPVHSSYTAAQRGWLWSVGDFIGEVRARQGQL
ncbi:type II restriction endonuclease [Roseovarius sp. SK2]|uniref:type II restriction endonuclease n=1 Tax=unclassified Roseovarius TaxID=2614913 RepID=UPI00237C12AE|nr:MULTISPECIES: type II restriction endonuclease [unclassified Roseovarius]MDD9728221.1 type II restriction endonuclease [Roseovarius sp. SK2]